MVGKGKNTVSLSPLQSWLVTLSIIFVSFFGVILALICIFALPDKSVQSLIGSYYFIGSAVVNGLLLFRWRKEKSSESNLLNELNNNQSHNIIKENVSDKMIKWFVAFYSFIFAFFGIAIALICIYALPNKTSQPVLGLAYFLATALILSSFIYVVWKNWTTKTPYPKIVEHTS
jgi:uncharacterized membrane protein